MKKRLLFFSATILLIFFTCIAQAQVNYQPGYAILVDGTRISGLIRVYDDEPWCNQRYIWLKDSSDLVVNSKMKAKKYTMDELKFYMVGNRSFDKVHYVDLGNLQLKSMGTNDHMMERLVVGRITAHRFYSYPADFISARSADELDEKVQQNKDDQIKGYKILSQKDNDKLQNAFDYDLEKYFADTPEIWEKFKTGGYGNEPIVKTGLAAKMVAMAKRKAFKQKEADGIIAAFNDYNQKNLAKQ